ncbi:MAG: ATP-grasp domain-containing protein [Lentilactobacillus diolivorans]|uniref:Phosphoribosylaminoimidazole carboxylase ATPase subunit n=2 Tax=Lentilactobacillus diolivorans TaxID=179838 RepID=A0A0R1S0B5_9LACO|nr:ATP-grasp domain-containing protein [Lentilactobacillus diolivorans]RRG01579.1 MAG: ATP-grasp domain-containing protein [Lactobacillus sp.]KRL62646.1 phosphoribosylaminoimidazole carboxylase ATPase subunit [Lentilactobacillus diolivorans DSM 14421]MCH4164145.1 ATP-grasp domain-containing protein [Lentilactobacillus diolivorans]MDH5104725.1 ATP-grasp domain-containing protein [Lentilactobacillus diolivorans]GEP23818.1 phosphoribosylglycinamide formyltransferase 2 [Lentilactobacillus diolivor
MANANVLYPGQTIGILGDSISSPELLVRAKKMGFNVGMYSSNENSKAMQLADYKYIGPLNDKQALKMFAERCDVVMYNNDSIDSEIIRYISKFTSVPQKDSLLDIIQDRLIERSFFETLNINMAPYATIVTLEDVYQAINSIGYPAILKPIQRGLLGGKELLIKNQADIVAASGLLDAGTYILESYVVHDIDYSIIVTRKEDGSRVIFPTVEVIYHGEQIMTAFTPAKLDPDVDKEMKRITSEIANNVDYVGTFEVSLFLAKNGSIYVNRVAPVLSPAGFVFDYATNANEFEQHLRAIAGLPLTKTISGIPTIFQTIRQKEYQRVQTQWVIKDNWHFTFYGNNPKNDEVSVGHVLIPTKSLSSTLMQVEATGIWNDIDFKTKYEKQQ